MALYKFGIKDFLLTTWMGELAWDESLATRMRQTLSTHKEYRNWNGSDRHPAEDMTWKATWPGSAMDAYNLIEEVIFGETFDDAIRLGLKKKR